MFQLTSIINYSITSLTTWPHNQAKKYNNVSSLSLFSRGKPLILQVNSLGKAKLQFAITLQFLPNRGEREKEHVLIYIIHRLNNKSFLNRREGFLVCYIFDFDFEVSSIFHIWNWKTFTYRNSGNSKLRARLTFIIISEFYSSFLTFQNHKIGGGIGVLAYWLRRNLLFAKWCRETQQIYFWFYPLLFSAVAL